jgi:hypothetical protein
MKMTFNNNNESFPLNELTYGLSKIQSYILLKRENPTVVVGVCNNYCIKLSQSQG